MEDRLIVVHDLPDFAAGALLRCSNCGSRDTSSAGRSQKIALPM
jgi:hypothetical protein